MTEKSKKPRLRFKGFTETWEQRKLFELGSIQTGNTPSTAIPEYYSDSGLLWVTPSDITQNILYDTEKKLTEKGAKIGRVIPANSILCTCIASIGKNAFLPVKCAFNQQINALTPFKDKHFPYFLFTNSFHWSQTMKRGAGGLTFQIVNKTDFSNIETIIPSLYEEEYQIGELFYKLDNLITLHQRKYDKFVAIKKALLEKMFPRDGKNVPEIRFKGFTETWEQCEVRNTFKITRGYVLATTKTSNTKSDKTPYPVYSSQTKDNGLMGYYSDYLFDTAITWTTDGANAGTVRFRDGKFYCTNVCGVLLSENGFSNKMVAEALNLVAWRYVSKVGNPKLMNNVMGEIEIVIPTTIAEQTVISQLFDKIDNLITLHQRQLERLKNIKAALLEKMFV